MIRASCASSSSPGAGRGADDPRGARGAGDGVIVGSDGAVVDSFF